MAAEPLRFPDALPRGVHEVTGRAMGSDVHILTVGGPSRLPLRAAARLEQLEARWSRFRPTSELSRLSSNEGRWCTVSADTWQLVAVMRMAWERTGGRCDASVLRAIAAAGYDRDLRALPRDRAAESLADPVTGPTPGLDGVEVDGATSTVRVPGAVRLDPGAIGKGFAADLVAAELLATGAAGALVNVGGDLVVRGEPVDGDAWTVELQLASGPALRWTLADGGVATSSSRRRRWRVDGESRHHLIDPATARPVTDPPATVSIAAGEGWWAEAAATAIAVGGCGWAHEWAPANAVTGVIEDDDGRRHLLADAERFLS